MEKPNKQYELHPIENIITISHLITIHYFEYDKTYQFHGESHDFWEMMYSDRGSAIVTIDESEQMLLCDQAVIIPPGHYHTIRADGQMPSNVIILSFFSDSPAIEKLSGKYFSLNSLQKVLVKDILEEGNAAFALPMSDRRYRKLWVRADAPIGSQQLIRLNLEHLLIMLLRQAEKQSAMVEETVRESRFENKIAAQTEAFLQNNLYRKITIADITKSLNYGKTYLSKVFRQIYGQSIMDYYSGLKIDEAKFLIREKRYTMSEIAEKLGFSSPQYFSRRFSRITHMSPQQYSSSIRDKWHTEV